jgi:hypothetical protein
MVRAGEAAAQLLQLTDGAGPSETQFHPNCLFFARGHAGRTGPIVVQTAIGLLGSING